jgi:hypothetical protein
LIRLTKALRDLAPRARCGDDLIALGEAWSAIQQILDGCAIDVNVGLSVGFRRGSRDFEEGLFMCFRINDEVIILDELNTTGGVLRTLAVLCTQQRWSRVCGHQRCQMARPQPVVVYPCLSGQLVGRDSARGLAAAARGRKWSAAQGPGG